MMATAWNTGHLRPSRSPKWPKKMPPSGRARKPAAKVPHTAMMPTTGSSLGKNSVSNTSGATTP